MMAQQRPSEEARSVSDDATHSPPTLSPAFPTHTDDGNPTPLSALLQAAATVAAGRGSADMSTAFPPSSTAAFSPVLAQTDGAYPYLGSAPPALQHANLGSSGGSTSSESTSTAAHTTNKRPLARAGGNGAGRTNKKKAAGGASSSSSSSSSMVPAPPPLPLPPMPLPPAGGMPGTAAWGPPPPPPPPPPLPAPTAFTGHHHHQPPPSGPWLPPPPVNTNTNVPSSLAAAVGAGIFVPPAGSGSRGGSSYLPPAMSPLAAAGDSMPATPSSAMLPPPPPLPPGMGAMAMEPNGHGGTPFHNANSGGGVGLLPPAACRQEEGVKLGEMNTHVGLLPGVRPLAFDKHLQGLPADPNTAAAQTEEESGGGKPSNSGKGSSSGKGRQRASREVLTGMTAEEKLERRRERARAYSHMVRRRTEANMRELMAEVERLTVLRLLIEEMPDTVVVVSPDPAACVLFTSTSTSSSKGTNTTATDNTLLGHNVGRPLSEALHPDDASKAIHGVLGVAAASHTRYRARLRFLKAITTAADVREGGAAGARAYVEMEVTMRMGTQGVVCCLRGAGEGEGFYVGGPVDEPVLVA